MENKGISDIVCSVQNGILKIVLNRPKKKNATTNSMYKKLIQIIQESIEDDNIHAIALTGTGDVFSSGYDFISGVTAGEDAKNATDIFKAFLDNIITYPKLLIAVVNGPAIGIAVTILPLFDMVYASDKATFETPFTKLGVVAEGCSTYTFPKLFGPSKAGDMLYLGYKMNALEAKQYGLVSEIYKHECLNDVWIYLKKLSAMSMQSILAIKRLIRRWDEKILLEVNAQEVLVLKKLVQSPYFIERMANIMSRKNKL